MSKKNVRRRSRSMARKPCDTCAFRDGEAWIADKQMFFKVTDCIINNPGKPFYCHQGMKLVDNVYQPPADAEGKVETHRLQKCGGIDEFRKSLRGMNKRQKAKAVRTVQLQLIDKFMDENPWAGSFRDAGFTANDLAFATMTMACRIEDEA